MGTSSRGPALSLTATGKPGLGIALEGLLQYPSQQIPWLRAAEVPSLGHLLAWTSDIPGWGEVVASLLVAPLCPLPPSTILVEPGCQAEVTETGDIRISVGAEAPSMSSTKLDPIQLSIFSHRFMSIAGEWILLSSL